MGSPILWFGNIAKNLQNGLQFGENATIYSGAVDPSAVATAGNPGDIYLSTSTSSLYIKQDSGTTTNWDRTALEPSFTEGSIPFGSITGALTEDNAQFFWDETNKRIGIGTNTPDAPLDVSATPVSSSYGNISAIITSSGTEAGISFNNTSAGGRQYNIISTGTGSGVDAGKFIVGDATSSTGRLTIDSNGDVGIGTTDPTFKLQVVGTFSASVSASTPQVLVTGSSSGTVSILPQANAGTFNFNLPITAGSSGSFLTSGGGGSSPMIWTDTVPVANGGTGITSGTSGGILGFTAADTITSSVLLDQGQVVIGGGAGATPTTLASGTQYQVLRMGALFPSWGALTLDQPVSVVGILPNANTTATDANTPSTIVSRDGSGNFSAGTITATLNGSSSGNLQKITGDIDPTSFSAANNQAVAANVTGLAFANASVRGFKAWASVYVNATSSLYEIFDLTGIQRGADWYLEASSVGDTSEFTFSITTGGQVQYTSGNYSGFVAATVKFRALALPT